MFCLGLIICADSHAAGSEIGSAPVSGQTNAQTSVPSGSSNTSSTLLQRNDEAPSTFDLTRSEGVAGYCKELSRGGAQVAALEAVCEFALSLRWKLPNVICDQERTESQERRPLSGIRRKTITAKLRYEDGQEQYSQITVDGKPAQAGMLHSAGTWSEGEYANGLRSFFLPQTAAEFTFTKPDVMHSTQVFVFDFKVERKNNLLWFLKAPGVATFPGYRGRLWIDQSTFHIVRWQRKTTDVEAHFPIQRVSTVVDYHEIALADGTSFVLPVRAENDSCLAASGNCWHDQLTFKHWHKFGARARVLTDGAR
jgi:hypothetical protein